jgi:DNA replication protein DnaC
MAIEQTLNKLHELRLSSMARSYKDQQSAYGIDSMGFEERFSMLVDAEWDSRRINKRTKLLRGASFAEPEANVADIRYDDDRKLDRAKMLELSNCRWIKERRNIVFTGSSGAGKSWLSCALGVAACNAFYSVRYVRLPEMIDELTVIKDEEWVKAKNRYIKCDLLILDDFLLEPLKERESRELLEIVEGRRRTGSLLLCSQFSPAGWHSKFREGAIADAIIDRLVHNSYLIHIEGNESMRKRMSEFN